MEADAPPAVPAPSAETLLKEAETSRNRIGEQHGRLPVIVLGIGFGAILAAALLARLPQHYIAAGFWNMPVVSPSKRFLLLSLLRWERFRLGSDVPSRFLRATPDIPPTVGLTIAALQLGRDMSAIPKSLPLCILRSGDSSPHPFEGMGFLNLETITCDGNQPHNINDLNQDVSAEFIHWMHKILASPGER